MTLTYKNKFNKYSGFKKDTAHSIEDIAVISGYNLQGLETILLKGQGAFFSNHKSVRPSVKSSTQWGIARIYSAIMGGKASIVDAKHLY